MNTPLVSVLVTVYNHEKYIKKCLLSIVEQKTSFPIEVWVGEDASQDNSREVLQELEPDLPDWVHIIYRDKNLNAGNTADLLARCTGKYLAILEGDDFWTYPQKLQRQADWLETHADYVACFHHCEVVDQDSKPNGERYPDCQADEYSFKEFFYCTMPGQTGSFMAKREAFKEAKLRYLDAQRYAAYPEDRRNAFILLCAGKVKVFQEKWTAYRHIVCGGTAYSATVKINKQYAQNEIDYGLTLMDYAKLVQNSEALEAAKQTYYRVLFKWSVGKTQASTLKRAFGEVLQEKRWPHYLLAIPRWYIVLIFRTLKTKAKLI